MNQPLFGIDLGGTKIEGIIIASKTDPSVIARLRLPTESEKGYQHIIEQIARVVSMLEETSGIKATKIGIGVPGTNDPVQGVHKRQYDLSQWATFQKRFSNTARYRSPYGKRCELFCDCRS